MKLNNENAFAMLGLREDEAGLRFLTPGYSALNARLRPVIGMMRSLTAERGAPDDGRPGLTLVQFDDFAHHKVRSLAFGRPVGRTPFVELIMDPYFHANRGYAGLRSLAEADALPPWEARRNVLFWRGRGSHNGLRLDGGEVRTLADVPRIRTALDLRDHPAADVKISGSWIQPQTHEEVIAFLARERILGEGVPMAEHARYRFQLDIDGVANAWATMERLLCGSCLLRIESPFEMWFHPELRAWEHYIPVRADAGDLRERLEWGLANPADARRIAEAGQRFALAHTYAVALERTLAAMARCRTPV